MIARACFLGLAFLIVPFPLRVSAEVLLTIGQNFTATSYGSDSDAVPADANGAIGPDHFVEFVNGRFAVFGRQSGVRVKTMTDRQFWIRAGIDLLPSFDITDPRIVFDRPSGRWFAASIDLDESFTVPNHFLLAISASSDPTGAWNAVAFTADPATGNSADFPTLGIDNVGVYLAADMYDADENNTGSSLTALPKAPLLEIPPNVSGQKSFGVLGFTHGDILQPTVSLNDTAEREDILSVSSAGLDGSPHTLLIGSTVENMTGLPTLNPPEIIKIPTYRLTEFPVQPDGSSNLDNGDCRMSSTVYRVGEILYGVHSTQAGTHAGIQWFKINATNFTVIETGIITDPQLDLFYPSIAANSNGVVVIGCNGSSRDLFVSSYAVVGDTSTGSLKFSGLVLLKAGLVSYQDNDGSGISRWGDYSATSIDPTDPNRFWTIQLYPSADDVWSTQITELITSPIRLSVVRADATIMLTWPGAATGFQLQYAANLAESTSWTNVSQTPLLTNGQFTITLPISGASEYFRLMRP